MPSILRQLQAEWNALVPQAQARGVRRVRLLNLPLETIAYRRAKLEWLRAQLGVTVAAIQDFSFGVEIECILPVRYSTAALRAKLAEVGITVTDAAGQHSTVPEWKIVYDGSVSGNGVEVVSPPLRGQEGLDQIRKVCQVLTEIGARVDRSCGFHVHVGVGTEAPAFFKRLAKLYRTHEPLIDSFMAPSRRGSANGFCSTVVRGSPERLEQAQTVAEVALAMGQQPNGQRGSDRYRKLNLKSYWAYGTVEFRHHQGTVDGEKAVNWVNFCLRACLVARTKDIQASTLDQLLVELDATPTEKTYFASRQAHFSQRMTAR